MIFALKIIFYYISCIFVASYISLLERKLIGRIQRRIAPANCGICGIFQPIADAIKLFFKQSPLAGQNARTITGGCLLFAVSLCQLTLIPAFDELFNLKYGMLLVILSQSLISFSETLIGTESNSRYGIIGGNRAYIQNMGGHLLLVLLMIILMLLSHGTGILDFVSLQKDALFWIKILPFVVIFFITLLITGNRTPFDFTEAESELVGGAYVECGGILFAMVYLADYLNLLFLSALFATLFLYQISISMPHMIELLMKTFICISFIILIRAILPRYTQKQMIKIAWHTITAMLFLIAISNGFD